MEQTEERHFWKGDCDMAWFGQGRDTIEWEEYRDDVLFYKWPAREIKQGSHLILRPGQRAIFYADGVVGAVFEEQGNFDIMSQIVPFSSTLRGWRALRGDSGMRAEVYFVNAKELVLPWGTRQHIMIPVPQALAGIPIGCNGNLILVFRDYQRFIEKVAGVKDTYSLDDIAERVMGELDPVVAEAILDGQQAAGPGVLAVLQQNSRKIAEKIAQGLERELADIGLGVSDVNILAFHYPPEVQEWAAKMAGQAMVGDVDRYMKVSMADSFGKENSGGQAAAGGMAMALGMRMADQAMGQPAGGRFCPRCRKMVQSAFCPDCGTQTM